MKKQWMYGLVLAACCGTPAMAQTTACSPAQGRAAANALDTIGSWQDLHLAFSHTAGCDKGAIAAGYSQAVALLLVEEWPKLPVLSGLMQKDPAFRGFVLHHIDRQMSPAEHKELQQMAVQQCPKGAGEVCRDILRALDRVQGQLRPAPKTKDLELPRP